MIDFFLELMTKFKDAVISLLPLSPFSGFIDGLEELNPEWIGWLNWFIPIKEILAVTALWLGAISLFYVYSVIMRWIKLIGD